MEANGKTLRELPVVILDAQATGASPKHGALLEIAVGVATAREGIAESDVTSRWVALPTRHRVPRVVRELTGYADADATTAIPPEEAWHALVSSADRARGRAAGAAPAIVHFAQFETPFLYDLHARFHEEGEAFPLEILCAHAIARRLYPDLPRSNIRALAGFLGHTTPAARRAHGHVLATAHVWSTLVDRLESQGITHWGELVAFLGSTPSRRSKRTFPMDKAIRNRLPDKPGVYRFQRSNGDVLYVGKATSLKKRIAGHFATAKRAPARSQEMLTQALAIDFTVTETALEAALLEVDEIKAIDPPYNVHLRDRRAWFTNRALDRSSETCDDEHPIGPLPAAGAVHGLGAVRLHRHSGDTSPLVRARAMQVPVAFAPEPEVFVEGVASFARQHRLGASASPRDMELVRLGFRLSIGREEEPESQSSDPRSWDVPRVVRHVERSVASGVRLIARGRWLALLADADIEIEDGAHRYFELRDGVMTVRGEAPTAWSHEPKRFSERQRSFDGARYDRLRVLNTELRRITVEGGLVRIRIPRGKGSVLLEGPRLSALLART